MKKLFITALLAITVAASGFAGEGKTAGFALPKDFSSKLKHFSDVEWTSCAGCIKATFILNNVKTEALYSAEGDLIGISQAITPEELPVNAKRVFAKKYDGHTIKEAIRFQGFQGNAYYIFGENEKGLVTLKVEENKIEL